MAVIMCEKCGMHYDDEKYNICPNCGRDDLVSDNTVSLPGSVMERVLDETVGIEVGFGQDIADDVTIGQFSPMKGMSPVVGWLVCTQGPSRGRDYRLSHGWNRIGRSSSMDIFISDDPQISRKHSAVVYDERSNRYFVINESGALTYLNGELVSEPTQLKNGDVLLMGESTFAFVPYCTEERKW